MYVCIPWYRCVEQPAICTAALRDNSLSLSTFKRKLKKHLWHSVNGELHPARLWCFVILALYTNVRTYLLTYLVSE